MTNPWIEHIRRYSKEHGISFGCAITEAGATYTKTTKPKTTKPKTTKPKTTKPPINTNEYKKRMNELNIILNDVNKLKKMKLREKPKPLINTNEYKNKLDELNIILNDVNKLKKMKLREKPKQIKHNKIKEVDNYEYVIKNFDNDYLEIILYQKGFSAIIDKIGDLIEKYFHIIPGDFFFYARIKKNIKRVI